MSKPRKTKAILDLEKKILELENNLIESEKQLKSLKDSQQIYSKLNSEKEEIINGIHDVLDDLGVKGYRDENKYYKLPLAIRLFAWSMSMVSEKIKSGKEKAHE